MCPSFLAYSLQLCMCFAMLLCTDTLETVLSVTITFMNIASKRKRMRGKGREEGRRREGREREVRSDKLSNFKS